MNKLFPLTLFLCLSAILNTLAQGTSVAGLYPLKDSGRIIYNFNDGWRFHLGDVKDGENVAFDDAAWEIVCAPHTVMLVPSEASGGRNYQGVCWYRKHFTVPTDLQGKTLTVHFEAIMGKQKVYVNGKLVKEHLGGYLPITIDLSKEGVKAGDECLIAVMADNSDDKDYPPGKKQSQLDFAYHGGMYRDVWLIGKSPIHITDPIERAQVAGGGIFLHYDHISEKSADVFVDVEIERSLGVQEFRSSDNSVKTTVIARIMDADGKVIKTLRQTKSIKQSSIFNLYSSIKKPHLWSPEDPYLYQVEVRVMIGKEVVDGGMVRMGIRKAEFRGVDGFWLNGKPYHQLIGGNRHQDFAYVGNALPNSQQWRDAKRLKDAGMTIIRAAHYPQDPSFMDACDELGLFVIVPTPGWQYWNKDQKWGEMVHQNTRDIIRRDRNHPCVLMWEPILNETRYPQDFAIKALEITQEEFPYPNRPVAAADLNSEGVKENYDVLYDWADNIPVRSSGVQEFRSSDNSPQSTKVTSELLNSHTPELLNSYANGKCVFTREWGEYVDDWYAHNAINRAARAWGEKAMLTAALSLSETYGMMYRGQRQFIGGCQWHPFDHQRGYHPDPYLGGIYDAFRQKKYAFEMFRSQVADPPMVFIAHEMTQYSDADVVVFSNCDSVRLTAFEGEKSMTLPVIHQKDGTPNAPVVFKGFWDFWQARTLSYTQRNWQKVSFVAEGIKDGQVVCSEKKLPARRSTKIRLYADEMGKPLVADGSDFIVVVAEVTDDNGNIRRNALEHITFSVEGEGSVIGDASIMANPRITEWGSAPVLIRSTHQAGTIRIIASPTIQGVHTPTPDTLTIQSIPYEYNTCHKESSSSTYSTNKTSPTYTPAPLESLSEEERRKVLEEVEKQQQDFGIQQ
ncbi:MAG: glycoside hydrolase family 2 [Prevotella sp.]|nr:glycoside hydrolase family 2 [Prevotella sp.]